MAFKSGTIPSPTGQSSVASPEHRLRHTRGFYTENGCPLGPVNQDLTCKVYQFGNADDQNPDLTLTLQKDEGPLQSDSALHRVRGSASGGAGAYYSVDADITAFTVGQIRLVWTGTYMDSAGTAQSIPDTSYGPLVEWVEWPYQDFAVLAEPMVVDYVVQKLGGPNVEVELSRQQVRTCIQDTLSTYTDFNPRKGYGAFFCQPSAVRYEIEEYGLGVVDVVFMDPNTLTQSIEGQLLIRSPISYPDFQTYIIAAHYRETLRRQISVEPDWEFVMDGGKGYVLAHVAGNNWQASYMYHMAHALDTVPLQHHQWVYDMSLAKSKMIVGEVRSKYSQIPSLGGQNIQMNGEALKTEAQQSIERLMEAARGFSPPQPPELW